MKRLEVETTTQTIVEYHTSEQAAVSRLSYLKRVYKVVKHSIKDVVRHIELAPRVEPQFTQKQYTEIK